MSIIQAFADRGAQCVIGFNNPASFHELDIFQNRFTSAILDVDVTLNEEYTPVGERLHFADACLSAVTTFNEANADQSNVSSSTSTLTASDGTQLTKVVFSINNVNRVTIIGDNIYAKIPE